MAIKVEVRPNFTYVAEISPPHAHLPWTTSEPMILRSLIKRLKELGCHPTDVGGAIYAVDRDWLNHLDGALTKSQSHDMDR